MIPSTSQGRVHEGGRDAACAAVAFVLLIVTLAAGALLVTRLAGYLLARAGLVFLGIA